MSSHRSLRRCLQAAGNADRSTPIELPGELFGPIRCTLAAGYDTCEFVPQTCELNVTPHVAQNMEQRGSSVIDSRTTRHAGYALSIEAHKLSDKSFGWAKDIGLMRRPKTRGRQKIEFPAYLTFAGYSLVRMRELLAPGIT